MDFVEIRSPTFVIFKDYKVDRSRTAVELSVYDEIHTYHLREGYRRTGRIMYV